MAKPDNNITISIGESEIAFDSETKTPDGIAASVKQDSKFLFEFSGKIADKFIVKKTLDHKTNQYTTEIFLERGIDKNREVTPLVRITHYS